MICSRAKQAGGRKRITAGFTLIEMLAVLAVLSILLGIFFYLFDSIMGNKEHNQARVELRALKLSLSEYQRKHGNLPFCEFAAPKGCNPAETLFLSLHGFHNEEACYRSRTFC